MGRHVHSQVLDLSNNAFVTDEGVAQLSGLDRLAWLNLSGSNQVHTHLSRAYGQGFPYCNVKQGS